MPRFFGLKIVFFFDPPRPSLAVFFDPPRPSFAKEGSTAFPKPLSPQGTGDVTALRCSEPLRSKVGGASKPSPYFAGWDRLETACFWLYCAWGQLASFPRHVLRAGTAWGTFKGKKVKEICVICEICVTFKGKKSVGICKICGTFKGLLFG